MLAGISFNWFVLGILIPGLFVVSLTLDVSYQESSSAGTMVPAYRYPAPDDPQWGSLFTAEDNHPKVISVVIINVGDPGGPGDIRDQNVVNAINTAKSKGMKPIGYVWTSYGGETEAFVKGLIDKWHQLYPEVQGIFFDTMANTAGFEPYYTNLNNYAKSKPGFDFTVGNPGTDTIPSYIGTVDNIVIHETCSMPTLQNLDAWHVDYDKSNFSYLVHSQTNPPDLAFVSDSANHVKYMYITHDTFLCPTGDNPWNEISIYIESLYATLDVPSVNMTIKSKDLVGNPVTPSNRNVEIAANGVKVRNDTSTLFYNATNNTAYTITVSNFGNFTFHHWENSSTNPTRTVTPVQNTTYTAFYNNTSAPAPYVVDLLDVYASNSTTLDSGTVVCLNVDLKSASSCTGTLNAGSTYRFEVEVDNTGQQSSSPTTLEFRDVVASGDVLGSIVAGNILNSGCGVNTNWSESIVTDDARATNGTACSIAAGGSIEYWMVITLDTDANDGTGTFFISNGTITDTSTTTTFTVNTPPSYNIDLLDVYQSSSTTLDSGTAVCLNVDTDTALACGTALNTNSTYRFEIEVDNNGEQAGSPDMFQFRDMIASADVFGSIPVGNILNSGCGVNTNWSESIVLDDAQSDAGTTCSIAGGGTQEYWMVVTLDTDADDGSGSWYVEDASGRSDTSSTTSFTVTVPQLPNNWYNSSWTFAKKITVDQTVIDSNLASFPLLVNITDMDLGSKAQLDCDDILFTLSNNVTKLNHEIENCDMANDWLTAWVKVDLSGSTDTIIFMYYGNSGATNQQNVTGTWKSSYELVAHLNDDFLDSTSNNNDGTNSGSTDFPNQHIADSQSFDGINDSISFGTDMPDDATGTISVWVRPTDTAKDSYITTSASDDLAIVMGYAPNDNFFDIFDDEIYPCTQGDMKMPATDDAWQLIAYSYSDIPDDVHGFKNGTLVVSDLNCSIEGEKTFLMLGSYFLGVDYLQGQIDEFRFSTDFYSNDDWFKARYECELGGGGCITIGNEGTNPSSSTNYVVDLLDVYQSSSTTLDSGTAVCLNVDLEVASSCATALINGSTYRFEIEVDNTGQAGSPTTLEFRDVVASGDVLGSIVAGNILNSGCGVNTNWSESIVTDDARATNGTACSIGAGGSVEYWMVITLDTDANDGTGTFFISDGTITDTTTTTTFTVNTPANYVVDLLDVYQSSSTTLDSGTAVCLDVNLKAASSCLTALNAGSTYRFEIEVDNTGQQSSSPTTLEFRDVVASGDVLGSIPVGNILNSGCGVNTNWFESIVTDDARASSGTACSISGGGNAEYWMVVTLDTDANDGTGTFFISDGTITDTSTITTFTVNGTAVTLGHKFVEVTTGQTTTSTTYTSISGATIADADLVDGKDYLLVFSALVSYSDPSQNGFIRAVHGSTAFEGSELAFEPTFGDTVSRYPYFWFTKWTAVAGEAVNLQFKTEPSFLFADVMRADQITMVAIKLSDDLTSGTDYHYAQQTTDTTIQSLYADDTSTASVTFTPNGIDDWLVLATAHLDPDSVTVLFQTRIHATGGVTDTGLEWIQEGEDAANDRMVQTLAKVYTPTSNSTTFEVETQRGSADGGTKSFNAVFALNLNKMNKHAFQVTAGGVNIDTSDTFPGTNVATTTLDPDGQGDVWVLAFDIFYPNNENYIRQRMQVDNTDQPGTQTSDFYGTPDAGWDPTDRTGYFMQSIENLTDASHTLDLDATTNNAGLQVKDRLAMMVTMKLGFIYDIISPLQFYFTTHQFFDNLGMALQNIFVPITIEQADAQKVTLCRDSCNLHQKIVLIFDSPMTESELRTTLDNDIVPLIEQSINTRFETKVTDKTMNNGYKLFKTDAGTYEFYPDFNISGQTTLTNDQLLKELDDTTTDIQNMLNNSTSSLQASNVHYTIDKSTGAIDTRLP